MTCLNKLTYLQNNVFPEIVSKEKLLIYFLQKMRYVTSMYLYETFYIFF